MSVLHTTTTNVHDTKALANPSAYCLTDKAKQLELKLAAFELKPLHILYLSAIHEGDFDKRLHMGHFAKSGLFAQRIGELIDMGLVTYNGAHTITPRGVRHMEELTAVQVKP